MRTVPRASSPRLAGPRRPLATVLLLVATAAVRAGDWPTYGHDGARSGVTPESLRLPLAQLWTHTPRHPPRPAWPSPAKHDYWHNKHYLNPRVTYDRAFHVAAVGDAVYFGSSADDHVTCLDAATGRARWTFAAEGPVRCAPTVVGDRVVAGSDDGRVYGLDASDGRLRWTYRPGPSGSRTIGNGRAISRWPVRTGAAASGRTVYCCAGLFPVREGVYLCALEAATGREVWKRRIEQSAQGYLAATGSHLLLPSGRTAPGLFRRSDGRAMGAVASAGGCYAVLRDDVVVAGPGDVEGRLEVCDGATRERIVSFPGLHLLATRDRFYVHSRIRLSALDRVKYMPLARERAKQQARDNQLRRRKDPAAKAERAELAKRIRALTAQMSALWLWRVPCREPYALVLAGDLLLAGGDGTVAAYRTQDGARAWEADVPGRAYGLAVARGRLLVSTDQGTIHCFAHRGSAPAPEVPRTAVESLPLPDRLEDSLLGCWLFRPDCVQGKAIRDLAGKAPATVRGGPSLARTGRIDAIELDGANSIAITEDLTSPALPRQAFTAEAWVRVDKPLEWGGVIGCLQDNGSYEKGWLLGYRRDRFCLAVASAAKGRLTYLTASRAFQPGRWHHVAGTYDGKGMTVYLDGERVAESTEQSGPIVYPPRAFYDMGAYHDDNEFYRLTGALHEVRVCGEALSPEALRRRYEEKAAHFPLPLFIKPPTAHAADDGTVEVRWESALGGEAVVEYGRSREQLEARVAATGADELYRATLRGLEPKARCWYRVVFRDATGGRPQASAVRSFIAPAPPAERSPWPKDPWTPLYERAAEAILRRSNARRGFCLVLRAGEGRLAWELARRSELRVVGVERDATKVAEGRRRLREVGLYGTRVVLHRREGDALPYPPYFANLIASDGALRDGTLPSETAGVLRVLRPRGGVACLGWPARSEAGDAAALRQWLDGAKWPGAEARVVEADGCWAVIERGRLEGAGEWTHLYANTANTACSGDTRIGNDLAVQWFGQPGPRRMVDRHHRPPSPLYRDGRLVVTGNNCLTCLDAYNGTILWEMDVPGSRRLGMMRDAGPMALADEVLYVAAGPECWELDVATGKRRRTFRVPDAEAEPAPRWGYTALAGPLLVGARQKGAASLRRFGFGSATVGLMEGDFRLGATSTCLFAIDRAGGRPAWRYRKGALFSSAIVLGGESVYLIESRDPKVLADEDGRLRLDHFLARDAFLVALDLATGRPRFERALDLPFHHVLFLSFAEGTLVVTGSYNEGKHVHYGLFGLDPASGSPRWQASFQGARTGGTHGEQWQHPAIAGGRLYLFPCAFEVRTGKRVEGFRFVRGGHGCGTVSSCATHLFYRGGNPQMRDIRPGGVRHRLNAVTRPNCWINVLPVGGLVLLPEGSSGCTCAYPLQTSIAYAPRNAR